MLSVNHLDIRYGDKHLFRDISVQVYPDNRIGLVGVNGAGKTTLLKIMAGLSPTDDGVVSVAKNFSIGYLPQESAEILSNNSLYREAQSAFGPLLELQQEIKVLHDKMTGMDSHSEEFQQLLLRQGELQHRLDASDIYAMDGKIEKVLLGLGFRRDEMEKPVSSFSGGWQMRLKLAKMLLEEPSLLLLDEPTNHLDLDSLTWIEQFLRNYNGAMVIISHDRAFLDKVTDLTWELSFGKIDVYKGNYSFFVQEDRKSVV
jgi:ATP-binding cassette subfamily F protein 3